MTRQFLLAAVLGFIGAGFILAQAPKPVPATTIAPAATKTATNATATPATQAPEPGTMVLRTKGQPDRKVVIVKSTKSDNGRVFTEVRDVATGETFLVADQTTGGAKDVPAKNSNVPMPKAAPKPDVKKAAAPLPKAKPRDGDPLLTAPKSKETAATVSKAKPASPAPAAVEPKKLPVAMKAESKAMPSPFAADKPMTMTKPATGNDPIHVVLPVGYVPPEIRMKTETADTLKTLQSAVRPTARQDAATALAEGRYADKMEIKMALAQSAMHDPAPIVRAHCIDCLSKLGYCAPNYVDHLRQCATDTEPCLKVAASNAMMKLEPKK